MNDHGGQILAIARRLGVAPSEILDFSASINPLGTPESVKRAIFDAIPLINHYPDSDATPLREAISRDLGVPPSLIVAGNGSTELIGLIPLALPRRHGRALVVEPAFSEYRRALERGGYRVGEVTLSPNDRFTLPVERIVRALGEGYDHLWLANPGNPSGRHYSLRELEPVVAAASRHGTVTVLDEAFIDFVRGGESAIPLLGRFPHLLILRSLTKFYAIPGLRLGFAVGGEETIGRLATLRDRWSVNTPAQLAGIAALADRHFRERSVSVIGRLRRNLAERLSRETAVEVVSGEANYLLLRLPERIDPKTLQRSLQEQRILIRPCAGFRGLSPSFVRVAVRTAADDGVLVDSLKLLLPARHTG